MALSEIAVLLLVIGLLQSVFKRWNKIARQKLVVEKPKAKESAVQMDKKSDFSVLREAVLSAFKEQKNEGKPERPKHKDSPPEQEKQMFSEEGKGFELYHELSPKEEETKALPIEGGHISCAVPDFTDKKTLLNAIILSEIMGRPKSLKRK